MYPTYSGKTCKIYNDNGQIIRQFNAAGNITQVNVSGDERNGTVMVIDNTGSTTLYNIQGQIIRKSKTKSR